MAQQTVQVTVVTGEKEYTGKPFVVIGCKATQADDPSYVNDFDTLGEAVKAYNELTYPIKTLEYITS